MPETPLSMEDFEEEVRSGQPPKEYQFKPGQSGNPKGARRKPKSLLPDLKRLFEEALSQKVTVKQGDKDRILSMVEAGIRQLIAQFAKGDRHARHDVLMYAEKFGIDLLAGHRAATEETLAPGHQAILDSYVARRQQPNRSLTASRVTAPPGLLDD
jgi:hypothetical protein